MYKTAYNVFSDKSRQNNTDRTLTNGKSTFYPKLRETTLNSNHFFKPNNSKTLRLTDRSIGNLSTMHSGLSPGKSNYWVNLNATNSSIYNTNKSSTIFPKKELSKLLNYNEIQKEGHLKDIKVDVFRIEDWKSKSIIQREKSKRVELDNYHSSFNNNKKMDTTNYLSSPQLSCAMMDTILRSKNQHDCQEGDQDERKRQYEAKNVAYESDHNYNIRIVKNIIVEKLIQINAKTDTIFEPSQKFLEELTLSTTGKFYSMKAAFSSKANSGDFIKLIKEISNEYYQMARKAEKQEKIIEEMDFKIKKEDNALKIGYHHTNELKVDKSEEKILQLKHLKINDIFKVYNKHQNNLDKLSQKKIQIESEMLRKKQNLKNTVDKNSFAKLAQELPEIPRRSQCIGSFTSLKSHDNSVEEKPNYIGTKTSIRSIKDLSKAQYLNNLDIIKDNYKKMVWKKSELTRRINHKKMDVRKDKMKLKDMYQRYFQDPESAFEKGILLDDVFARLYYIKFQVEDLFFHTSLTEPEINYIKQSGKIKSMWLKIEEANEIKIKGKRTITEPSKFNDDLSQISECESTNSQRQTKVLAMKTSDRNPNTSDHKSLTMNALGLFGSTVASKYKSDKQEYMEKINNEMKNTTSYVEKKLKDQVNNKNTECFLDNKKLSGGGNVMFNFKIQYIDDERSNANQENLIETYRSGSSQRKLMATNASKISFDLESNNFELAQQHFQQIDQFFEEIQIYKKSLDERYHESFKKDLLKRLKWYFTGKDLRDGIEKIKLKSSIIEDINRKYKQKLKNTRRTNLLPK